VHCVHVGSYVNDPSERDVTSFGVRDVAMMNDVSRCDDADKVLAGPYRCSPAIQVTSHGVFVVCVTYGTRYNTIR